MTLLQVTAQTAAGSHLTVEFDKQLISERGLGKIVALLLNARTRLGA